MQVLWKTGCHLCGQWGAEGRMFLALGAGVPSPGDLEVAQSPSRREGGVAVGTDWSVNRCMRRRLKAWGCWDSGQTPLTEISSALWDREPAQVKRCCPSRCACTSRWQVEEDVAWQGER